MTRIESQMETRSRLDVEMNESAYERLATSVTGSSRRPESTLDDLSPVDSAVLACLKACGVEPGNVPESVSDLDERIDWLCRPSGTMYRNVQLTKGWQKKAFGPMLGELATGEPVALLPFGTRAYCYLEPKTGRKIKVTRKNIGNIETEALLFYKPLPPKPLSIGDLARFIFRAFSPTDYLAVVATAAAVALIGLALPGANQIAFGTVAPSGQAELILPVVALLLGAAVSSALMGAFRNLVVERMSTKFDVVTLAATFARVLALPPSFFRQYSSGELGNRISIVSMLAQQLSTIVFGSGLTTVLSLIYIFQISAFAPQLTIPALAVVVIQAALIVVGVFATIRYERATMEARASVSGIVTSLLNGVEKIKLGGAEDRAFAKWADGYANYAQLAYNRPIALRALPPIVGLVGLLGIIAIYWFAGTTHVSVANYMAFNAAYGQASAAIMTFAALSTQLAQIRPLFDMVKPILEANPEIADDKPSVQSLSGSIEISGLSFRYDESLPYVLDGLSLKVEPREYVAIVGKSGCGKSTIMRLLLGFEKPERGAIFYDRHDAQRVDLRSLRQQIGVVTQESKVFMGDIFNNIIISSPQSTLDDAWEAAELAGIADDIRKMPMGMQTLVTEGGGGISGGQRQRLMIARAICGKPRILLFDEATSALDNKTQKHVADSLATLDCTRIVVAHRLSTVQHCDRILVLDGGKIAEEGTYDELIAQHGIFYDLVERQQLGNEGPDPLS